MLRNFLRQIINHPLRLILEREFLFVLKFTFIDREGIYSCGRVHVEVRK